MTFKLPLLSVKPRGGALGDGLLKAATPQQA
jgi:hypothetical protein